MNPVAISHGTNLIQTLEQAINYIGGIEGVLQKETTVFIKPDLTLPLGPPITIQPQVLGYIVKHFRDQGAKTIYIGFNPFDGVSSSQVFKLLGLDYYLQNLGGTILNLETEHYIPMDVADPLFFETVQIPEKLVQSDIFVSIVAPRTDVYGGFSLGLKNYFGLLNDKQKQELYHAGALTGLLDFFKIRPAHLTIWDAWHVGVGQGPFNQRASPYNLILTSSDVIAGDSVMTYLTGSDPSKNQILRIAADKQLGVIDPSKISILGQEPKEHRKIIENVTISLKSPIKEFEIIKGQPCAACQISLRYFLDFLLPFMNKDIKEFGGFTCFTGKFNSVPTYNLKKGVILFGDCAVKSKIPIEFKDKTQKKKHFFQFSGCSPLNLRKIEKFCLNFKEWLPSLEIIEEFVRKWTLGRFP